MKVYVGRDAFHMASILIACYGNEGCERVALDEVKRRAFKASPSTAAGLMFWAGVLSRAGTKLASDEAIKIVTGLDERLLQRVARLHRRSAPQVLQAGSRPAI